MMSGISLKLTKRIRGLLRSVMHRSQLYAGLRRRQAAGRMNAGVAGVKDEDALHITFDSRRGEIEGK